VPLAGLLAAAASVDRTAASSAGWRTQVAVALETFATAGTIVFPSTRFDTMAHPPLPAYVTRPAVQSTPRSGRCEVVWHAALGWAAELDSRGELAAVDRAFLAPISSWLSRRRGVLVPVRERSLEIFGDEKLLERYIFGPLFAPERLSFALLETYPCWPPVQQTVLGDGPWLLVENHTTYHSLSLRARACGFDGRLVWTAGTQVGTRLSALAAEGASPSSCWYFGDIDSGGLRAARLAERRAAEIGQAAVDPARGLYRLALDRGSESGDGSVAPADLTAWASSWLGEQLGDGVADVAARGGRIVQEHVGVEVLAQTSLCDWFG
jgi:hypothetical protein